MLIVPSETPDVVDSFAFCTGTILHARSARLQGSLANSLDLLDSSWRRSTQRAHLSTKSPRIMSVTAGHDVILKIYQSDWSARPSIDEAAIVQLETAVTATLADPRLAYILNDSVKVSSNYVVMRFSLNGFDLYGCGLWIVCTCGRVACR